MGEIKKSETLSNLATALASFQAEVKNPANTADNPFYKSRYAPLADVLHMVRPLLAKHGLSLVQAPGGDGELIEITTMLLHTSGEWLEFPPVVLKAERATPQGAGSAMTYGRRYGVSGVLAIASEDDDDGNVYEVKKKGKPSVKMPERKATTEEADSPEESGVPTEPPAPKSKPVETEEYAVDEKGSSTPAKKDPLDKNITDLLGVLKGFPGGAERASEIVGGGIATDRKSKMEQAKSLAGLVRELAGS